MAEKSKILIIGATGYIGKFIVEASSKHGHPTFVLVRETTASDPKKSEVIQNFKNLGVSIIYGDIYNHESLVSAIKQVDVVISAVGTTTIADQVKIIAAIKEVGTIKRFLPSEFASDGDSMKAVEPAASLFREKVKIRRIIESEKIPYTYVVSNGFAGYFLPTVGQLDAKAPPREKVVILGDGNRKAIFVKEEDIATYTIKAVDDPRTLNKILHIIPPANALSFDELVSLWESKIGKTLEKTYILEEQLLKNIQDSPLQQKLLLAICHAVFVNGLTLKIDPSSGVEASEIYPEVKYTTMDEYLNHFV
ncbi:isoflavone reductase homolog A622-like [Olea europaea var. sylvestris]|uniref:isoflavone reductase homolog A622-like n=1 Tax=Olea europaea var. sylvestris TaxID=158386 RepID=UPI000C1CFE74|nr:isoflavone reductase homolog A622-like [Olea europaea var. sylvestris]